MTYYLSLPQMTTVVSLVIASVGKKEVGKIEAFIPSFQRRKITTETLIFPMILVKVNHISPWTTDS